MWYLPSPRVYSNQPNIRPIGTRLKLAKEHALYEYSTGHLCLVGMGVGESKPTTPDSNAVPHLWLSQVEKGSSKQTIVSRYGRLSVLSLQPDSAHTAACLLQTHTRIRPRGCALTRAFVCHIKRPTTLRLNLDLARDIPRFNPEIQSDSRNISASDQDMRTCDTANESSRQGAADGLGFEPKWFPMRLPFST
jgi:hypothetical protein